MRQRDKEFILLKLNKFRIYEERRSDEIAPIHGGNAFRTESERLSTCYAIVELMGIVERDRSLRSRGRHRHTS